MNLIYGVIVLPNDSWIQLSWKEGKNGGLVSYLMTHISYFYIVLPILHIMINLGSVMSMVGLSKKNISKII
jgi:hypothetical protein